MPELSPTASTSPSPHELGLVGSSPAQQRLWEDITRFAPLPLDVTLLGASGTGKTTVAEIIHKLSPRRAARFCTLNCANLPADLVESELFGTERGSYTSAVSRPGLFEQASGGTLFLDEVGELSQELQAKLLTVVESKTIRRLGGAREIPCDVRLIYATKRELSDLREDLMFRLDGAVIRAPTLLERIADLPQHVAHQFQLAQVKVGRREPFVVRTGALTAFARHTWPGNIRELANIALKIALDRTNLNNELDGIVDAGIVVSTIELVSRTYANGQSAYPQGEGANGVRPLIHSRANLTIPTFILVHHPDERFDLYTARVLVESYAYLTGEDGMNLSHSRAAQVLGVERTSLYRRLRTARVALGLPQIASTPPGLTTNVEVMRQ